MVNVYSFGNHDGAFVGKALTRARIPGKIQRNGARNGENINKETCYPQTSSRKSGEKWEALNVDIEEETPRAFLSYVGQFEASSGMPLPNRLLKQSIMISVGRSPSLALEKSIRCIKSFQSLAVAFSI